MKKVKENIIALGWIGSLLVSKLIYNFLNNNSRNVYNLTTDLDRITPFLKIFVIPYLFWFLFLGISLTYLCLKKRRLYYKTLIIINIGMLLCYVIYYFFQTTVTRPFLEGSDILSNLVKLVYNSDQPYNCFPSSHCFTTYVIMKSICSKSIKSKSMKFFVCVAGLLIITSTLFMKQHVIMDAISAVFLGQVLFYIIYNYNREALLTWDRKPFLLLMTKRKSEI